MSSKKTSGELSGSASGVGRCSTAPDSHAKPHAPITPRLLLAVRNPAPEGSRRYRYFSGHGNGISRQLRDVSSQTPNGRRSAAIALRPESLNDSLWLLWQVLAHIFCYSRNSRPAPLAGSVERRPERIAA